MAISKNNQANIDDSNLAAYPNGQVKDNDGTGDGFPLNRVTTSDIYEFFDKLIRLAGITFNNSFDNETNGYQFVAACVALASKSDYVLAMTTTAGVLQVPTKLGILQVNEKLLVKAASDWSTETTINGSDAVTKTFTTVPNFKAGDYLLMINTGSAVTFVRLVTKDNISVIAGENAFLQATNNSDELAGTRTNVATTPASNKYVFTQRVNDPTNAAPYLATVSLPGIMSAADKTKLNALSNVTNRGAFNSVDAGGGTVGTTFTCTGNLTSATITALFGVAYTVGAVDVGRGTQIRVVMANAMANTSYKIQFTLESLSTLDADTTVWTPVFQVVNTTTFDMLIREGENRTQALKIHIDAIQL